MKIIYGQPGTGKTTRLLNIVDEHLQHGTLPERIAFLSFTRKAAQEAAQRASQKFGLHLKRFQNFRTIHSLCFSLLGSNTGNIMQRKHLKDIGEMLNIPMNGGSSLQDDGYYGMLEGDRLLHVYQISRLVGDIPIEQLRANAVLDEEAEYSLHNGEYELLKATYEKYKEEQGLVDFTDLLEEYVQSYVEKPAFEVLIIDEAQDLSRLQWMVIEQLAEKARHVYVAGDDDQAIFTWAGADVDYFMNLAGEREILKKTWRLNDDVARTATKIAQRIQKRVGKNLIPTKESTGRIHTQRAGHESSMPLHEGNWMLLARNGYLLSRWEEQCLENGYSFTSSANDPHRWGSYRAIMAWEKHRKGKKLSQQEKATVRDFLIVEDTTKPWFEALAIPDDHMHYFRECKRNGEKLVEEPRIRIATIHSVKGGEADNVGILTDVSEKSSIDNDAEHRVWYVGVTRTKENLWLVEPETERYYGV